jgi:hypothetical protein
MVRDTNKIWVYRITPIQNLEHNLRNGLHCKRANRIDNGFVTIGSKDVINRRDKAIVKCFPDTVVNDYVPFYFSYRTPMLYNIITGYGVPAVPQGDIVYLCCRLNELATDTFQWCYTNGNAAIAITKFYNTIENIDENIDWHSIETNDFRDENADGDEDRVRKKHAEFLVKSYVSVEYIKAIIVLTEEKGKEVKDILAKLGLTIEVRINPQQKFYFL